ncbi:hypothetical protein OQA88_11001 [Cercophora sp. LCS_1]
MFANIKYSAIIFAALVAAANAVVVNIYHDSGCEDFAGQRNVWDNTCAPTGSFSSFQMVSGGATGQVLRAYSRNACVVPETACARAYGNVFDTRCHEAYNDAGASNALGSWFGSC